MSKSRVNATWTSKVSKFSHSHSFISGVCDKQDFPLRNRSIDGPKMMVIRVRESDNNARIIKESIHVS